MFNTHTHTVWCTVLGLVAGLLLFSNALYAGSPNPSAASSFDSFNQQNGNNWTSQWNNQTGYSQAVITWGKGYQGRGNLPASTPHLFYPTIASQGECVTPTSPTLPPAFVEDQKLSILGLQTSPSVISEGNGYTNTTMFDMSFAVMHTDALQGQVNSQSDTATKVFYIVEQIVIMDSSNNTVATLYNTTYVNPDDCINRGPGNKKDSSNECEWMGAQESVPFTPTGYSDGVYSYQLTAALYRESINNGQDSTKLITTAKTGTGTIIIDSTPPTITITEPSADSVLDNSYPQIVVDYHDNLSCIDTSTFGASLDYTDVTSSFITTDTGASFQPSYPLSDGVHDIDVSIRDMAGNIASTQEDFSIFTGSNSGAYYGVIGFLQNLAPVFGYPADLHDLRLRKFHANFSGTSYIYNMYEFDQYVNGVPVIGGGLKVVVNVNYQPIGLLGNYYPGVATINTTPSINADTAKYTAIKALGITVTTLENYSPELKIFPTATGGKLVWEIKLWEYPPAPFFAYTYFIDAQTGMVTKKENNAASYYSATGNAFVAPPITLSTAFTSVNLQDIFVNNGCLDGVYVTVDTCDPISSYLECGLMPISGLIGACCLPSGSCISSGYNIATASYIDQPDTNTYLTDNDSNSDILTDEISAYYDIDLVATALSNATGFKESFQGQGPQIKVYTNAYFKYNSGLITPDNSNTAGDIIYVGAGNEWQPSQQSPGNKTTVYLENDFTREPSILYHEYGHVILYSDLVNIVYGAGTATNDIYDAYHEGFADTNALFMTGDPTIDVWLLPAGERDANNKMFGPDFTAGTEPHEHGQVYSGAMWDLRNRLMNTYAVASDAVWWLDVNAAELVKPNYSNPPPDFSFVIQPLQTAGDALYYALNQDCINGKAISSCPPPDIWHEIESAFAGHGVLPTGPGGSVAIATPDIGIGKSIYSNQPLYFTIYGGSNMYAQIFFSNTNGGPPCGSSSVIYLSNPSSYQSYPAYPGCNNIDNSGYGCAVYDAENTIYACNTGNIYYDVQTWGASANVLNSSDDGPAVTQYITLLPNLPPPPPPCPIGSTCQPVLRQCNPGCTPGQCSNSTVPFPPSVTVTNVFLLCLPGIFVLLIKSRVNKKR